LMTLAGSIAHDFNNVLGVIVGFSTMAREDASALAASSRMSAAAATEIARIISATDRVIKSAGRAREIAASLNRLGKERSQEVATVDLRDIVGDAEQLLRVLIPASVRLEVQVPDVPCHILCAPVEIEQIITNLVINGVHAMEGRAGRVAVRLEILDLDGGRAQGLRATDAATGPPGCHIEATVDGATSLFVGVLETSRYVRLGVEDDGCGMSVETLHKILTPFFTTKEPDRGSGLGLSSVLDIVVSHRGGLHIRSHEGAGTSVMALFPEVGAA
jgi:two-component system cell cycle sensor histidine kinase/response regulator CckA